MAIMSGLSGLAEWPGRVMHAFMARKRQRDDRAKPESFWRRGGRISRLHLYEAKERFFSLKRKLEHEEMRVRRDSPKHKTIKLCQDMLAKNETLLTRRASDLNRVWRVLTNVHLMLLRDVLDDRSLMEHLEFCREEAFRLRVEDDPSVSRMLVRIAEFTDQKNDLGENRGTLVRALAAAVKRLNDIRIERILFQKMNIQAYNWALFAVAVISAGLIANHRVITRGMPHSPGEEAVIQLFSIFDADPPGLTAAELTAGGAVDSLLPVLDRDGDQTISRVELSRIGTAIENFDQGSNPGLQAADLHNQAQMERLVAALDRDEDGSLSRGELFRPLSWVDKPAPPEGLPEKHFARVFAWTGFLLTHPSFVRDWISWYLSQNVLAFVFLAGLAGGLFSVVMRIRTRGVEPGEDAYKRFYILTKPVVGAFGAMLLFILLGGGLMSSELVSAAVEPGIKIFGFGILAGFSERVAFPRFR